ncbi:MAG: dihydropteroate synthase [Nitrospirota bacterium]
MIVIADNLNTRNRDYTEALRKKDAGPVAALARKIRDAGAEIINVQCSLDGAGDEEALPWVTGIIGSETGLPVSLDSRNVDALKATLLHCKQPPLMNFISETEPKDQYALLSLVSASGSSLVLRASRGTVPNTLEAKLQILEGLIEMANEADIPNARLFADPSLVHLVGGMGQTNLANSYKCIKVLADLVEPPINTVAWIANISIGLEERLKKQVEASLLFYLAGAGLDAAIVDVLDDSVRKALSCIKSFRDEMIFSQTDLM